MNRRKFLQILGLAAAAPAAVARLKRPGQVGAPVEPAPPRVAYVVGNESGSRTRTIVEETRFAPLDFRCLSEQIIENERRKIAVAHRLGFLEVGPG